jgi:hypothetical protein
MLPLLRIENKTGIPVLASGNRITPFAQSVQLSLPGFPGGVVWNRPLSILVESANGEERVIRIADITRRVQVALFAGGFLGGILLWIISQNRNTRRD